MHYLLSRIIYRASDTSTVDFSTLFENELSIMDEHQKQTVTEISNAFHHLRMIFAKRCDDRERELLEQSQEIYKTRRQQLIDLPNQDRISKLIAMTVLAPWLECLSISKTSHMLGLLTT